MHGAGLKMAKVGLQLNHELSLVKGELDESDIVIDPVSGKKTIAEKNCHIRIQQKADLQSEIDELNMMQRRNFDRLSVVMAREDE